MASSSKSHFPSYEDGLCALLYGGVHKAPKREGTSKLGSQCQVGEFYKEISLRKGKIRCVVFFIDLFFFKVLYKGKKVFMLWMVAFAINMQIAAVGLVLKGTYERVSLLERVLR